MKRYFLLFMFFLIGLKASPFECSNYQGICIATESNKIYQPVLVKSNATEWTYNNGIKFPPQPDYYDYQLAASNSCKEIGGRLPNNEELMIIAEYFKLIPILGKQVYFWSSEKKSQTFGYALRYDSTSSSRIITEIFGNNVSRSNGIEALCVK